jgi:hypothetical protein
MRQSRPSWTRIRASVRRVNMPIDRIVLVYEGGGASDGSAVDATRTDAASVTCALGAITHTRGFEKPEWRRRQGVLGVPVELRCRGTVSDEQREASVAFPSVLAATPNGYRLLLDRKAIEECDGSVVVFHAELCRVARGNGLSFG